MRLADPSGCTIMKCSAMPHGTANQCGPVAQLGARFHGMEEVKGSNPFRSTKTFQTLTGLGPSSSSPVESNWSPKPI